MSFVIVVAIARILQSKLPHTHAINLNILRGLMSLQCVKELAHVSDVIRQNYWLWFAENLCADFSELLAQTK